MSSFDATIAVLQDRLRLQEEKLTATKKLVNDLCRESGRDPLYPDAESGSAGTMTSIQADTFYGQPLNASARKVLEMRRAMGLGPATVKEIHQALEKGGYQFSTKNTQYAMDGLRQSLSKASHTFHKLPSGQYGLSVWYPSIRAKKERDDSGADTTPAAEADPAGTEGGDK